MTFQPHFRRRAALTILPVLWVASMATAQPAFPTQPITLVVPFAAGGGTDLVARVLAQHMEKTLGQPVLVDNKPGVNGNLAGAYVAKAKADGYTVLYNTSSIAISPAIYRNLGYDVMKDLAPVGLSASIPTGLIVAPNLPIKTMGEFLVYVKAHSGQMAYGSSGLGNINHMSAVQLSLAQGMDAIHVPYKGSSAATIDLAGGRIHFMIDTVNNITGFVREGKLRLLAVATAKRLPMYPDVPTFAEAGVPDLEGGAWSGVMVPARTPPEVIARLNTALLSALNAPEVRQKLSEQGTEVLGSSPEQYGLYLRKEITRWAAVAKRASLVAE